MWRSKPFATRKPGGPHAEGSKDRRMVESLLPGGALRAGTAAATRGKPCDQGHELGGPDRLVDLSLESRFQSARALLTTGEGRECGGRDATSTLGIAVSHEADEIVTVLARQADVAYEHIRRLTLELLERFVSRSDRSDRSATRGNTV